MERGWGGVGVRLDVGVGLDVGRWVAVAEGMGLAVGIGEDVAVAVIVGFDVDVAGGADEPALQAARMMMERAIRGQSQEGYA